MFEQWSSKIAKKLVVEKSVQSDEETLYKYGVERLLVYSSLAIIILFISFLFESVYLFPFIMFYFISLRSLKGGVHFDNDMKCYTMSIVYIVLVMVCYRILLSASVFSRETIFFVNIAQIFLTFYLPALDHPNKKITRKEAIYFKSLCNKVLLFQMFVVTICYFFTLDSFLCFSVIYYVFFHTTWILGTTKK